MTLFEQYLYKIIELDNILNEDIKFIVSFDGSIRKESDGKSKDLDSSPDLTVNSFFEQLKKNIREEEIIKIKMNNVDLPSVDSFTLNSFIDGIKSVATGAKISGESVISRSLQGFVFKIKSEPAKNLNDKTAIALLSLKDLAKRSPSRFNTNNFFKLLKTRGNLSTEITKTNVFGEAKKNVIDHIQINFLNDDTVFNDFIDKVISFCDANVSENIKNAIKKEFIDAKNAGGSWEITMSIGVTTGAVGKSKT